VLVSGLQSDAHTWNLVFVELLLEERGYRVVNLGPCVPVELLVAECRARRPVLVVLGSVNGHGYRDGRQAAAALRADPGVADPVVVIGGKLGTSGGCDVVRRAELLAAGADAVFDDETTAVADFLAFLAGPVAAGTVRATGATGRQVASA
jgi:methylaspartate mutase sigma subunit